MARVRKLKRSTRKIRRQRRRQSLGISTEKENRRKLLRNLKKAAFKKKADAMKSLYNSVAYRKWRKAVFTRDKHTCVMCRKKKYVEAHHILRKWDYPELIFNVDNGATLCGPHSNPKTCHGKMTGREYVLLPKLLKKLKAPQRAAIQLIIKRKGVKVGTSSGMH